jgi:SAM-dependent methyltransferase
MLPWFLRHYSPWVEKMVMYVEPSTDGTEAILRNCPKVEIRPWPHRGLDDDRFLETVNACYAEARGKADWVAFVDPDELLWDMNLPKVLAETAGDVFPSMGMALISKNGWPDLDDPRQLYEIVTTGLRQPNFDKLLLCRPEIGMEHTHGRHTYPGAFPKHRGKVCEETFGLFHCHHLGGIQHTEERNARNYARCGEKAAKFGWNYDAEHNSDPNQSGSLAWVAEAILSHRLIDVFTGQPDLLKLHLGCGAHHILGWENHDIDVDITQPLPFPTGSASLIFCEHCVEHITHQQAWRFFEECFRVLAPGGTVRIAVPDLAQLALYMTRDYQEAVKAGGHGDGSRRAALRAVVFEHGHQAVWCRELLVTFLAAVGFQARAARCGYSTLPELHDIEQHWKTVGREVAGIETCAAEGTKPAGD